MRDWLDPNDLETERLDPKWLAHLKSQTKELLDMSNIRLKVKIEIYA